MDPHRPRYHFLRPANWMNDPNGLIQWQGVYHLFYQCNPEAAVWGNMHWGHASSSNLIHWQHLPTALAPTPGGPDHDGVWSGCAVNWNGLPAMLYTGRDGESEHVCLAFSHDGLHTLEKYSGNPVLFAPPPGLDLVGFRDPCVWQEDGQWWMTLGTGMRGAGGAVLLYSSPDLTDWQYHGPLITAGPRRAQDAIWTGEMWECPSFFPLGGQHVLLISAMDTHPPYALYTLYMTGAYRDHRFSMERLSKMDWGDVYYYAPQAFLDERGRRIAIGWSREARSIDAQVAAGWAGVMTLPRLLDLHPDGRLLQQPIPEAEALRGERRSWEDLTINPAPAGQPPTTLEGLSGDTLEMIVDFDLREARAGNGRSFGLLVRRSPGGEEQTEIRCEPRSRRLVVGTRRSSQSESVTPGDYEIPFDFSGIDTLRLRVFLDCSIIEVYADDLAVLTARVYPSRPDSTGIALFAEGGPVRVARLDAWQMQPVW